MPTVGANGAKVFSVAVRVSRRNAQQRWFRKFPQISASLVGTGLASLAWQPSISGSTASTAWPKQREAFARKSWSLNSGLYCEPVERAKFSPALMQVLPTVFALPSRQTLGRLPGKIQHFARTTHTYRVN